MPAQAVGRIRPETPQDRGGPDLEAGQHVQRGLLPGGVVGLDADRAGVAHVAADPAEPVTQAGVVRSAGGEHVPGAHRMQAPTPHAH
ncbi:MAG: hypothetical protein QM714_12470, partial [Nocardioides sp.]